MASSLVMASPTHPNRFYGGAMTGTSLDGIDAAVIEVTGVGLDATAKMVSSAEGPLEVPGLRDLTLGAASTPRQWATITTLLSQQIAAVLKRAATAVSLRGAVVHGQTIFHQPPYSVQLADGAMIAHAIGCPVATMLRAGDLAAGGRGAPITPLGDWMLLRDTHPRAIVNLGGFCNITWLPGHDKYSDIHGGDICPCNLLLDEISRRHFNAAFDDDGTMAAGGSIIRDQCTALRKRLAALSNQRRSLGTGDEVFEWIDEMNTHEPADIAATAAEAIGTIVAESTQRYECSEVIIAGGGDRHEPLMKAIRRTIDCPVQSSTKVGLPSTGREAACMAALGALEHDGIPPTLPEVTGRREGPMIGFQWCQPC